MPGVEDVTVSVTAGTMTMRHGADVDLAAVERKVTSLGYEVAPHGDAAARDPAGNA